ncbi:hypothetical protein EDC04DRAFT_2610842 [Pisolithus marmoratus]|nr:hypothetical protein EDC04DRAFT_2610842 [Pisolithus marmoratus]
MASAASVDNDNQIDNELDNTPGIASDWYKSDGNNPGGDNLNIQDRPLVQQLQACAEPDPLYPPSRFLEDMEEAKYTNQGSQWAPFHNEGEWDLAHFLMKNVGQMKMDEFLKLSLVHTLWEMWWLKMGVHNGNSLNCDVGIQLNVSWNSLVTWPSEMLWHMSLSMHMQILKERTVSMMKCGQQIGGEMCK